MKNYLIGISGKIGSGKDTAAEIIKLLIANPDFSDGTIAHFVSTKTNAINKADWHIKKFAGVLKEVASLLTGIPTHMFEDQDFKKTLLGNEWGRLTKENPLNSITPFKNVTFLEMMSVREFLQKLGTDAMRNGLHPNTWVNATFANYKPGESKWIITDVRFPNEAEAIENRDGVLLRINRNTDTGDHPSETALDHYGFKHVIENKGTMTEFVAALRTFCLEHNLLKLEPPIEEYTHVEGFF